MQRHQRAFSLLEMAIVLLILALLLGSSLRLLEVQFDLQRTRETQKMLEEIRESLIGFAMANGRLPCPASPASQGIESPVGGGVCTQINGLLPAASLGLPNVDNQGFLPDAWGLPSNRIRYAVSTAYTYSATTPDGIRATGMTNFVPNLSVCASASGITSTSCGSASALTNTAVAVIYSLGKNAASGGSGLDESTNLANTRFFVSHPPTASSAPNDEFDDLVTWLSINVLYSRMVQAGRLP
ncbi:MAG: prepilin-type N-terminal cleavage/methylation domain-containing protein [Sterolibacterium sp.]|nr:prepilin-type N-terminal cleavage/methylation domain-containing protein [Sterolibacterium sp.]